MLKPVDESDQPKRDRAFRIASRRLDRILTLDGAVDLGGDVPLATGDPSGGRREADPSAPFVASRVELIEPDDPAKRPLSRANLCPIG
jgi:hypothetical protein